jgi:uncharacterized lipoprotein YmbA
MKTTCLIGLAALIGLGGCFRLAREEPPQHHYVLGGTMPQQSEIASPDVAGPRIGVRRLQLATYLESPFIVVRRGAHQISFSEFHRWGERLDGGINQAVARYLAARAPFRVVDVAPWTPRVQHDYLVQLQVLRFEGVAPESAAASDGEVQMLATWEIIRQKDGAVLARGTTDYREAGWSVGDYAGLVTSLDRGLNVLSGDLVSSIAGLDVRVAEHR